MDGTNRMARRLPWVALVFSFLLPGLGHVYCGRLVRGLSLALLYAIACPLTVILIATRTSIGVEALAAVSFAAVLLIAILSAADACRIARRTPRGYEIKDSNRPLVYILLILMGTGSSVGYVLHVRDRFVQAFVVPMASMAPTLLPGDRVLADKTAYIARDPERGDLVIFPDPRDRRRILIKRVVAVAGDTVEGKRGDLFINGEKLERREVIGPAAPAGCTVYLEANGGRTYTICACAEPGGSDPRPAEFPAQTVPAHHCFCLGDNREDSLDSRAFGPVPVAGLRGRAGFLYWPARSWSRFGRVE